MSTWRISLWEEKSRIWIQLPYEHKDILKENVGGVRWEPDQKCWHAKLDWEVARDIRQAAKKAGAELVVVGKLAQWAKDEKARRAKFVAADDYSNVDVLLPRVRQKYPHIIEAMSAKPWQIPGAQFIADQRRAILADDPGLGKTLQTLAAIIEADVKGPILVIAPKSAVEITWPEEIENWLGKGEFVIRIGTHLTPEQRRQEVVKAYDATIQMRKLYPRSWVIMEYSYMRIAADVDDYGNFVKDEKGKKIIRAMNHTIPELFSVPWAAVIVDESHKVTAGGSPGVGKRRWSAQRLGLDGLDVVPGGIRIAISGTPFRGKTENLWGTLNWLDPKRYTSYWNWIKRHYGTITPDGGFASMVKGDSIIDEKRFYSEMAQYMVRRTKGEVAQFLPPKTYGGTRLDPNDDASPIAVWLPMTPQQTKQYNEIVKSAMMTIDEQGTRVNVKSALAEMVRMKQVANSKLGNGPNGLRPVLPSNKIQWIVDFVRERQTSGIKVIIASQFTSFLELLSEVLNKEGFDHYILTGKTSASLRKSQKKAFQGEDGHGVFLLNTIAGGVSLTLDAADDVVICDQTYIPDDQIQVEDRAHRISRVHKVTIWYLCSLGTIDEDIAIINAQREASIASVMDGQRGVGYTKRLIAMTKNRMGKAA